MKVSVTPNEGSIFENIIQQAHWKPEYTENKSRKARRHYSYSGFLTGCTEGTYLSGSLAWNIQPPLKKHININSCHWELHQKFLTEAAADYPFVLKNVPGSTSHKFKDGPRQYIFEKAMEDTHYKPVFANTTEDINHKPVALVAEIVATPTALDKTKSWCQEQKWD